MTAVEDDAQVRQMMEALPRAIKGDLNDYPLEWMKRLALAQIVMEHAPGEEGCWTIVQGTEIGIDGRDGRC
jgi:hypothetical protein